MRAKPSGLIRLIALFCVTAGLASCGGGGSSSSSSASSAQQCVAPRSGTNDALGSITTEKAWLRSYMDETYLWYKDIPAVDSAPYTAAAYGNSVYNALNAYFEALKTKATTSSGKRVDQFSFTIPTAEIQALQSGITSGYGMRLAAISTVPPRLFRVLYVEAGSPAATAGIARGDTIRSVDGVDINDATSTGIATLNAGLSPTVASKTTVFGMQAPAASVRSVTVTSSQTVTVTPVAQTSVINEGIKKVGYLVLNSFNVNSAEQQLVTAINTLKTAAVSELVLDLRYNGGGYLDIANQLGWMIGGTSLAGKVFEKTICNDKNPFAICNTTDAFQQTTVGFSLAPGQVLPQLGLSRVFVLTSASTCSASESIINGLSPFLQVIRIGSTTCGKPYGFYIKDNCGTSYAAIQFKGENAVGFGAYADGFAPTCQVADDLTKARGDRAELMLAGALNYISTGVCPPASTGIQGTSQASAFLPDDGNYRVMRSPLEESRFLNHPEAR